MKIAILSINPHLYSTKKLVEAFNIRGHQTKIINYTETFYRLGETNSEFQIIIPRSWHKIVYEFFINLQTHTHAKRFVLNSMDAILFSKNRVFSLQKIAQENTPIPATLVGSQLNSKNYADFKNFFGSSKFLVKPIYGAQGEAISLIQSEVDWNNLKNNLNFEFYFQEYLEECQGEDIRTLILGNTIIGSMRRKNSRSFLANIHQGGIGEKVELTSEEKSLVLKVASSLKLDFVGIDFLRSKKGPLIIDINSTPGFEGIDQTLGINSAELVVDHCLQATQ